MAQVEEVVIRIVGDTTKLEPTLKKLRQIGVIVEQDEKKFKSANDKMQRELTQTGKKAQSLGKKSKQASATATKSFDGLSKRVAQLGGVLIGAFAIKQIVGSAIKILKDFEKELSTLQSITGSTAKEMEFFAKASKEIGKTTKTSATEVVKAFTLIGSAQPELLKNQKALAAVTEQALILSKAAGIDATTAAQALTSAMNQFGASASEAAKFTDIFATSQQKGSSFIAATNEALKMVGASADAVGLSFETTNAAIQALAKGAIVGSQAGTSLNAVLAQLSKQNDDSINPSVVGLSKALEELSKRQLSFKDATKLVQIEGAKGLLTLIKQRDTFEELNGALNESGNAMEQMRINTDNLDGDIDELGNSWEDFILSVVDGSGVFSGALRSMAQTGTDFLTILQQINEHGEIIPKRVLEDTENAADKIANSLQKKLIDQVESGAKSMEEVLTGLQESITKKQERLNKVLEDGASQTSGLVLQLKRQILGRERVIASFSEQAKVEQEGNEKTAATAKKATDAFKALTKRIATLRKELQNQALAGEVNTETINELNAAVKKLEDAELRLKVALTGTLEPMKAQKLALEDIGDSAETAEDLIRGFNDIQQEEIEKTENKRLDAIDKVSQAEQQAFRILAQLNTNKLIGIDNEEAAQLKSLEAQGLSEEELARRKLEIQTKSDEERSKILTKQAKADKLAAIFEATIATAVAVTQSLSNPILAAIVGVLGAAEIASIAAQPIPTFHEGKKAKLKDGEIFAKILESETVIPPSQSKTHKKLLDSVIDGNLDKHVWEQYMLPMMQQMSKEPANSPYSDMRLWSNQKKQIRLSQETLIVLRGMKQQDYNPWGSWN